MSDTQRIIAAIRQCPKDESGAVSYETLTALVGCMEEVDNWKKEKGYGKKHPAYNARET